MPRRRILFPFVGDSLGGSSLSAMTLIEHLDRGRLEPVVTLSEDGPIADELRRRAIDFAVSPVSVHAGRRSNVFDIAYAIAATCLPLRAHLARLEIDIVHTNDLRNHLTWSPAARLAGVKHVWHCRQLLGPSLLWSVLGLAATGILAVSKEVASTLPQGTGGKTRILPNPISAPTIDRIAARAALRNELGISQATPLIGFVGNLMTQKRPGVFVEAASLLPSEAHFVMIGDDRGGERSAIEALARDVGIADRLHLLGFRSPVEPLMAAFDVLVAPGVGDSFGRTLVEAMLVGTPVVASNSGGHRSIIASGETGLLVQPDDPGEIAAAVARLLNDPTLAMGLAAAAKREGEQRYAPPAIAREVEAFYSELLSD